MSLSLTLDPDRYPRREECLRRNVDHRIVIQAPRRTLAAASRLRVYVERTVIDRAGTTWRVKEIDASELPGNRGPRCLIFETTELMRRIWQYPRRWFELSDAALLGIGDGKP
jgi:hypothetical protein